jgi:hypothetical protein
MSKYTIIISPVIGVVIFFLATFAYAQQENVMKYPQVNMNLNFSITDNDYRVNDKQPKPETFQGLKKIVQNIKKNHKVLTPEEMFNISRQYRHLSKLKTSSEWAEQALALLTNKINQEKPSMDDLILMGSFYQSENNPKEAIKYYEYARVLYSDDIIPLKHIAMLLQQYGHRKGFDEVMNKINSQFPENIIFYTLQASQVFQDRFTTNAYAVFSIPVKHDNRLALLAQQLEVYTQIIRASQKMIQEETKIWLGLTEDTDADKKIHAIYEQLKLKTSDKKSQPLVLELLMICNFLKADFNEFKYYLKQLMNVSKTNEQNYYKGIVLLVQAGEYQSAIELLNLKQQWLESYNDQHLLARLYTEKGDLLTAMEIYHQLNHDDIYRYVGIVSILYNQGKIERARTELFNMPDAIAMKSHYTDGLDIQSYVEEQKKLLISQELIE